jgi:hypothetical protein
MRNSKAITLEKSGRTTLILALFTTAAVLLLTGVFVLHEWAEATLFGHAVQHLVIFSSGLSMGVALLLGYSMKKHR